MTTHTHIRPAAFMLFVAGLAALTAVTASCRVYTDRQGTVYVEPAATVQVPSLIGLDANAATRTLQSYQLLSGQVRYSAPTAIPQYVVAQNPAAGAVVTVRSYVSYTLAPNETYVQPQPQPQPPAQARVPALVGLNQDQARATLASVGLSLGAIRWSHSDTASGVIIAQSPEAGTVVAPGSAVSVALSSGPEPVVMVSVSVPSVANLPIDAAQAEILRAGLRVGSIKYEQVRRYRPGTVVSQEPAAGLNVRPGTQVDLVVAAEQEQATAIVPSLIGLTYQDALNALAAAGLSQGEIVQVAVPHPQAERVISQTLVANSRVERGRPLGFTIGKMALQPTVVLVPRVIGYSLDQARDILVNAGLELGRLGQQETAQGVGLVISQNPSDNASVARGTAVSLIIGVAQRGNDVPNVMGLAYADAVRAINNAGLTVGEVRQVRSHPRDAGKVLSMSPPAGTRVAPGGQVSLEIGQVQVEPATVTVPRLIGMDVSQAQDTLALLGLSVGNMGQQESIEGAGLVLSQNPIENSRVTRGSAVNLVVGIAPAGVAVPEVQGMTQGNAVRAINAAGLVVGEIRTVLTHPRNIGRVVAQSPQAGSRIAAGGSVSLEVGIISVEPLLVKVPKLTGLTLEQAQNILASSGLVLGSVSEQESREAGLILSQNPQHNTRVAQGSVVNVVVGVTPAPPALVVVPQLTGLTLEQAQTMLASSGLVLGTVGQQESREAGRVLSQNPQQNLRIARGSAVSIVVGVAPAPPALVVVPNLTGLPLEQAQVMLASSGLVLGTIGQQESREAGIVLSQNPQQNARVARGTAVNLVVGIAPRGVQVPQLVGLMQDAAARALASAGLQLGAVTRQDPGHGNIANNTVLDQTPDGGTVVNPGSAVSIVVCWHEKKQVKVPQLRSKEYNRAVAELAEVGLTVGRVERRASNRGQAGKVLDQDPAHNSLVWEGTAVNLVIGEFETAVELVLVPLVAGFTEAEAVQLIEQAGLKAKVNKVVGIPRGRVLLQLPLPGTPVERGSTVTISVPR